ncbi:hypothetical protein ACJX0J_041023 [Zea mays]
MQATSDKIIWKWEKWSSKIPSKIKVFMWFLENNIPPVSDLGYLFSIGLVLSMCTMLYVDSCFHSLLFNTESIFLLYIGKPRICIALRIPLHDQLIIKNIFFQPQEPPTGYKQLICHLELAILFSNCILLSLFYFSCRWIAMQVNIIHFYNYYLKEI